MKTDYHAKYYAYEIDKQCSSGSVEKFVKTLSEAQVQLNPHQIDAALFAFKSPLSKGAILADEVGLGKTIEAGIIISQYWAENKKKILIIMPSSLRKQWQQELEEKFFLNSIIMESKSFKDEQKAHGFRHNPFEQDRIVICSYNFARNKDEFIKDINWDLVVIDEAHRLRNVYKKSNKISNAIKMAVSDRNKILLTATPLQNSLLELYGLTSIIDNYTFGDLESFKAQYCKSGLKVDFDELKRRIAPICQRTLRKQVLEYIKYTNRIALTEEFIPTNEEQELYEGISQYLLRDRLYALPQSQRKLMTLILRRLLASSTYAISGTIGALAQKLQNIIDNNKFSQDDTDNEIQENIENYDEIKDDWLDDEEDDESEDTEQKSYSPLEIEEMKKERDLLYKFYELAKKIEKNAKGEKLLTALNRGFEENTKSGGSKKALIFTESIRTQQYIKDILEKTIYKDKIVLFNGSNNDNKSKEIYQNWCEKYKGTDKISGSKTADKRAALVEYFKNDAEIMIATEAAAEGINLQFCSLIVNYDLPWNPQRIEQRIGRCHRYGQKNDVVVVNFLNRKNAADVRVYQLLNEKFQLFNGVFGASDEVLGAIGSGMDFEKRIAEILQTCRTEEEINRGFDELQDSMKDKINDKTIEARKKLLENFDAEVAEKLRISKISTENYLNQFEERLWNLTKYSLNNYAEFDDQTKSFNLHNNPYSNNTGFYKLGKNIEDAHTYRIGHPLAQNIIKSYQSKNLPIKELVFEYTKNKQNNKISALEDIVGKSGWLVLKNFNIKAFEEENFLLFAGYCDDGNKLEQKQCERLFTLDVSDILDTNEFADEDILKEDIYSQEQQLIMSSEERNTKFFEEESIKLDKWAEDKKNSLEIEIKNLDKEIKDLKAEVRKKAKLADKLELRKEVKKLEKKRKELRDNFYKAQDEIEQQEERLIDETEARLKQYIHEDEIFKIRWKLV